MRPQQCVLINSTHFSRIIRGFLKSLPKSHYKLLSCNAAPWLPTLWKVKANQKEQEAVKHWTPPQCRGHCALCANNPGAWWLIIVVQSVGAGEQRAGAMSTISSFWRSISSHLLIWKKRRGKSVKNGRTWTVTIYSTAAIVGAVFPPWLLQVSTATQEFMCKIWTPRQTKAPDYSLIE